MNTKLMKLKKKKGFTLIELIIVIAIIGLIAAFAIPNFITVRNNAKKDADINLGRTVANAVQVLVTDGTIIPGAAGTTVDLIVPTALLPSPATNTGAALAIANYVKAGTLKMQTPAAVSPLTITIDKDGAVTTIAEKVAGTNIILPAPASNVAGNIYSKQ